jgi:hypothetical protein
VVLVLAFNQPEKENKTIGAPIVWTKERLVSRRPRCRGSSRRWR